MKPIYVLTNLISFTRSL